MTKEQFIAMSFIYGLKCQFRESEDKYCRKKVIGTIGGVYNDGSIVCHDTVNACPSKFKLILRPLSDLTKEIEHSGEKFVPIDKLKGSYGYGFLLKAIKGIEDIYNLNYIPYESLKYLIEWHFDVANLISKGEAIDVNTLKSNPYK